MLFDWLCEDHTHVHTSKTFHSLSLSSWTRTHSLYFCNSYGQAKLKFKPSQIEGVEAISETLASLRTQPYLWLVVAPSKTLRTRRLHRVYSEPKVIVEVSRRVEAQKGIYSPSLVLWDRF